MVKLSFGSSKGSAVMTFSATVDDGADFSILGINHSSPVWSFMVSLQNTQVPIDPINGSIDRITTSRNQNGFCLFAPHGLTRRDMQKCHQHLLELVAPSNPFLDVGFIENESSAVHSIDEEVVALNQGMPAKFMAN
uniref:Uncharacterized protein n=1 Tax=Spongospora subterranea TaxID=70186 RepID=A0A0H5RIJ8_9EUKA|eukprot:CRZ08518.1 hypothetical protein [Spongospora subterranea]